MHKKFEIIQIKIKGGCQPGRKVVTHKSKSDLPLVCTPTQCSAVVGHRIFANFKIVHFYYTDVYRSALF